MKKVRKGKYGVQAISYQLLENIQMKSRLKITKDYIGGNFFWLGQVKKPRGGSYDILMCFFVILETSFKFIERIVIFMNRKKLIIAIIFIAIILALITAFFMLFNNNSNINNDLNSELIENEKSQIYELGNELGIVPMQKLSNGITSGNYLVSSLVGDDDYSLFEFIITQQFRLVYLRT